MGVASTPKKERLRAKRISAARKGMTFSAEHKRRLSLAHTGLRPSKKTRARMSRAHLTRFNLIGRKSCKMCTSVTHTTEEHHERCTAIQHQRDNERRKKYGQARPWKCGPRYDIRGKKNWRWTGGKSYRKTPPAIFRKLRPLVLERDGYKCFQCGSTKNLVVHHIDHIPEHDYMDNLITLCRGDNSRAEHKPNRVAWEKKFRKYTKSFR